MGMFDSVIYSGPCPWCGQPVRDWQSKNGGCALQKLTPKELMEDAMHRERYGQGPDTNWSGRRGVKFYSDCECKTWVEVSVWRRDE